MCLLCDDEKAYAAYMNYLDAMERQGKAADPDKAIDAVLDALEANERTRPKQDDPANDKTLSPFFCSPINKNDRSDIVDARRGPRGPGEKVFHLA